MHTYNPTNWKNAPDHKTTPINADNLNHIEQGIANAYSDIAEVNGDVETKADKTDLASIIETSPTASQEISVGIYFYLDGVLVKAKTAIASGATFTENTNYTVVTAGALNLLLETMPYTAIIANQDGSTIDDFFKNVDTVIRGVCLTNRGFTIYLDWRGHRSFLIQGFKINSKHTFFIAVSNADATTNYVVDVSNSNVTKFAF